MSSIEDALRGIAPEWPETPDVWPAVVAAIDPPRRRPRWYAAVAAAAIAMLVLAGAVAVNVPAIAERLGIGSVEIEMVPVEETASGLDLGSPAPDRRGDVPVPEVLGEPDAVYADQGVVWLVYLPREDLPEILDSGVGALIARIDGATLVEKAYDPARTDNVTTTVRGRDAVWLEGGPHTVFFPGAEQPDAGRGRLAGNTLLWVEDGATYRIETAGSLEHAIRIAESMEP